LSAPTYLVIGHITLDVVSGGYTIGGTATYSAVTAARLGWEPRVLTSCSLQGKQYLAKVLPADQFQCLPAGATTTFENVYVGGTRRQHIRAVAEMLRPADVPREWLNSDIVHIGPVAEETDPELLQVFAGRCTLGVTPQGWLRTWDSEGAIRRRRWEPDAPSLSSIDAIVLSEEDVNGNADLIEYYAAHCPLTVVTKGYRGCTLHMRGDVVTLNARAAREVDPTGAGDVFSAAFFVRLHETGDPILAARFANVAGSFSVEQVGIAGIPSRPIVEAWLADHPDS